MGNHGNGQHHGQCPLGMAMGSIMGFTRNVTTDLLLHCNISAGNNNNNNNNNNDNNNDNNNNNNNNRMRMMMKTKRERGIGAILRL